MNLEYFKDKICTVLTIGTAAYGLKPDDKTFINFFSGKVIKINTHEIWLEHLITKAKSMFIMSYVVSIMEEQIISKKDEGYSELKEHFLNRDKPKNIQELAQQANQVKEKFGGK